MNVSLAPLLHKRIAVAVSGGRDSMALLHFLSRNRDRLTLFAVHCEHGIRGEDSLADAELVKTFCAQENIPLFFFREDCIARAKKERVSLETAARNFRYRCFDGLLKENKADFVATAHHALDNAETVLFRLCRGSALSGLCGIGDREGYLRPLLHCSRGEIDEYVRRNGVPYRDDETNFASDATRNFLRLEILPALEERIGGAAENISRFASLAAEDEALLSSLALSLVRDNAVLLDERFPLFTRACLAVLKKMGVERDYTSRHLFDLYALIGKENGKKLDLPGGVVAYREYDRVSFARSGGSADEVPFREGSEFMGRTLTLSEGRLRFDADKLPEDAVVRLRRQGDRFRSFGGGEKSLGDWFTDKKIPLRLRGEIPVVASGNRVYIVGEYEIADEIRVTGETKRVLSIKYK